MSKRRINATVKDYPPAVFADLLSLIDLVGTDKAYRICKDLGLKGQREIFEKLYL